MNSLGSNHNPTQKELVLNYLETNKYITPLKARHLFRVERLAEVIRRLRVDGYDIVNRMTPDETGRIYSRYALLGSKQERLPF